MQSENSPAPPPEVACRLKLLHEADDGHLENLRCPQCGAETVSVWFTHPMPIEYRTWFVCGSCDFNFRVQDSSRPKYYSESRVDVGLEAYDLRILSDRRL